MLTAIALCAGASLGALSRWQLGLWLSTPQVTLPWGTLVANWVGAYAIGVAVVFFQSQTQIDPTWRLAIITGFLGSGKTTLLQMIGCLDQPTSGSVWVNGKDVTRLNRNQRADMRRGTIGFDHGPVGRDQLIVADA